MKVLQDKWWQGGKRAAVWAAPYLLTPSRGGATPQHPHKSLWLVWDRVWEGMRKDRREDQKEVPNVSVQTYGTAAEGSGQKLCFSFFPPLQKDDVWRAAVCCYTCSSCRVPCILLSATILMEISWRRNPAPTLFLPSITAIAEELLSNQVCAHHPLPKSPEAVSVAGWRHSRTFLFLYFEMSRQMLCLTRFKDIFLCVKNTHSSDSK